MMVLELELDQRFGIGLIFVLEQVLGKTALLDRMSLLAMM
jgi:hypothetical protein